MGYWKKVILPSGKEERLYFSSDSKDRRLQKAEYEEKYNIRLGSVTPPSKKEREEKRAIRAAAIKARPEYAKKIVNWERLSPSIKKKVAEARGAVVVKPKPKPRVKAKPKPKPVYTGYLPESRPGEKPLLREGKVIGYESKIFQKTVPRTTYEISRAVIKREELIKPKERPKPTPTRAAYILPEDIAQPKAQMAMQETKLPSGFETIPPYDIGGKPKYKLITVEKPKGILPKIQRQVQMWEMEAERTPSSIKKQLYSFGATTGALGVTVASPLRYPGQTLEGIFEQRTYTEPLQKLKVGKPSVFGEIAGMVLLGKATAVGVTKIKAVRVARAAPEIKYMDVSTQRLIRGDTVYDISKIKAEVRTRKRVYEVKGTATEKWFPEKRDVLSRMESQYRVDVVKRAGKPPKSVVKDTYLATGKGLGRTRLMGKKSIKVMDTETITDIRPTQRAVTITKTVAEVMGKETRITAVMKGKEFAFKYPTKKFRPERKVPIVDVRPKKAQLVSMGRFTSGRLLAADTPIGTIEYWKTIGKAEAPKVPKGYKIRPDERGVFMEERPYKRMFKEKKGELAPRPPKMERLIEIGKPRRGKRLLKPETYERNIIELVKTIEISKIKTRVGVVAVPGYRQAPVLKGYGKVTARLRTEPTTISVTRPTQKLVERPVHITGMKPMTETTVKPIQVSPQKSIPQILQKQVVRPMMAAPMKTITPTTTTTAPVVPIVPPPLTGFIGRPPKQQLFPTTQTGYDVYVKRKQLKKGKGSYRSRGYIKANVDPLTKRGAAVMGAETVDRYSNRSYYIQPTTKKAAGGYQDSFWPSMSIKFRSQKRNPNIFVEKSAYAIDSYEEREDIPYEAARLRRAGLLMTSPRRQRRGRSTAKFNF